MGLPWLRDCSLVSLHFIYRLMKLLLRIRALAKVDDHDGQNFVLIVADNLYPN